MYAAAGGASLASRQARKKQQQQKLKAQQKTGLQHKPPEAKQFQNYTDPAIPRLSRVERGTLKPPGPNDRRHSTSNYHLKEPHGRGRLRESPSISIPVQLPQPLTPCTLVHENHLSIHSTPSLQSQLPQIFIPPDSEGKLERRCSFIRQVEESEKNEPDVLDKCNHICNFEIKDKAWEANTHFYQEYERDIFGSLEYPFSECSQGRAAWQERQGGRRCSLSLEEARQHRIKQTEAHHRWMKRNRIHDSTYGSGMDEDDFFQVYHQSAAANALLYVGLGTIAIGSVIFFVGSGEKGFKTLELRLIGPTLCACGLLCCLIRLLLCACPLTCLSRRKKTRLKSNACHHSSRRYPLAPKYDSHLHHHDDFAPLDNTTLLRNSSQGGHHNHKKKVSIVPPNHSLPSTSTSEFKDFVTVQPSSSNVFKKDSEKMKLSIPQINLPDLPDSSEDQSKLSRDDSIIEMQNLDDLVYDLENVSSGDDSDDVDGITVIETQNTDLMVPITTADGRPTAVVKSVKTSKLTRVREPSSIATTTTSTTNFSDNREALSIVIERNDNSESSEPNVDEWKLSKTNKFGVNLNQKSEKRETLTEAIVEESNKNTVSKNSLTSKNAKQSTKSATEKSEVKKIHEPKKSTDVKKVKESERNNTDKHSGILLSPLQLGQ